MYKLKNKIKELPSSPGVYLMKDSLGGILYVGKSKRLKSRVQSYFYNSANHSNKINRLVQSVKDIDIITTDTEFEAFLLECHLIQELKPVYNKRMKSPESYCYIGTVMEKDYRKLNVFSTINDKVNDLYFGPYTSRIHTEEALSILKEFYKIDCLGPFCKNRACFNYTLGSCIGMCIGSTDTMRSYELIIDRIIRFLNGESSDVLDELNEAMNQAIELLEFEKAGKLRDYIKKVKHLQSKERVMDFAKRNLNVIVLEWIDEQKLKLFFIKGSKLLQSFVFQRGKICLESIISLIVTHFYDSKQQIAHSVSKKEADEAQIIFSYLQNSQNSFIVIQDDWLQKEKDFYLKDAVKEFLDSVEN